MRAIQGSAPCYLKHATEGNHFGDAKKDFGLRSSTKNDKTKTKRSNNYEARGGPFKEPNSGPGGLCQSKKISKDELKT